MRAVIAKKKDYEICRNETILPEKIYEKELLRSEENFNEELNISDVVSSNSNESDNFDNVSERCNTLSFLYTNSRSLPPKLKSLIEMFNELELDFAAISETWMSEGKRYEKNADRLEYSEELKIIRKSRSTRGGGVAIIFSTRRMKLSPVKIRNNVYEVVGAIGRTTRDSRKLLIVSAYYPPQMRRDKVEEMNRCISDLIDAQKAKHEALGVIMCGDINNKDLMALLTDHPDIQVLDTPTTRKNETLDLCLTNLRKPDCFVRKFPPLVNEEGQMSDHDCIVVCCRSERRHIFEKKKITFRPLTNEGQIRFGSLLATVDWAGLHNVGVDEAVCEMDRVLDSLYKACFPEKTRVIKSSDAPWMTTQIRRLSNKKRKLYRKKGKTENWKKCEQVMRNRVDGAKISLIDKAKKTVIEAGHSGAFFKAVNVLKSKDAPPKWNISSLYPDLSNSEIADLCVDYFSAISKEYQPIPRPVPFPHSWTIEIHEISNRLKYGKKPKSRVKGDIPKELVSAFPDLLAIPLYIIYNKVLTCFHWPSAWKLETVKVIPKSSIPDSVKDLRNISCTPLFSKVLEFFVLKRLREHAKLSKAQFGGLKGVGIEHFLCETWHEILCNLEDKEAATSLVSIDFSKAFNRMDHSACIEALREKNVPGEVIGVVQAFLHDRRMQVHINGEMSKIENAPGGAPQGSVLGSELFCHTTDKLSCIEDVNLTPRFDQNGYSSDEEDRTGEISPIAPPPSPIHTNWQDLSSDASSGEEIWLGPRRPNQRLLDTTIASQQASQSAMEDFLELAQWNRKTPAIKSYVDDYNVIEKVRASTAVGHYSQGRTTYKVRATQSENIVDKVGDKAGEIGMIVNEKKTQLLCVSQKGKDLRSFMKCNDEMIESGDSLKILGFTFGTTPDVSLNTSTLVKSYIPKLWAMRFLKRSGMKEDDLLVTYKASMRPSIEFGAAAYHSLLTAEQSESIERLQMRSMKIVFGDRVSYRTVIESNKVQTLETRRCEKVRSFATKAFANERFRNEWFPLNHDLDHDLRRREKFYIPRFRTERGFKSPIIAFRRILNDMNS